MSDAGKNLWGAPEGFAQAWHELTGDFILRARLKFPGLRRDSIVRAGWRVRSVYADGSLALEAGVHGDGLTVLEFRRPPATSSEQLVLPVTGAEIIQLERRGPEWIFSAARSGEPFVTQSVTGLAVGGSVEVGLFASPASQSGKTLVHFHGVRIIRPPPAGYVPYRDYLGSLLEILDVHTGALEVVHRSAEQFEAPNWLPDGRTLLLNISGPGPNTGLLITFDLVSRQPALFNTGIATRNNNDHVLSFDGRQLAISHHSTADQGRSVIYRLPATGGTPVRVTPLSPSYLHGWSPDGRWLTYTGGRPEQPGGPDKYNIYKIPVEGGAEVRLTTAPGLNDGPEYSPDGAYIYFNSSRTGRMQLWRMRPDGTEQEQLTHDGFNNWFPHLSPDGQWIAFLSYGADVPAESHPYYQQVYVRLMPAAGGPARVIAYVYGGQGTINVPSWSPDGKRLAFVSNTGGL